MNKINLRPIENRILNTPYMSTSSLARSFSMISPELVYYAVNNLVTYGSAVLMSREKLNAGSMNDNSLYLAALIRVIALILATAPLIYPFIKEYPRILPKNNSKKAVTVIATCLAGMAFASFFNVILTASGLTGMSKEYAETADSRFLLPIWGGIIVYGIITPVTEEIVHRGLIYNRVRRYFNLPIAMVISPLIFGVAHGNLPQMVYAFILGVVICIVYEKTGAFLFPVLFHAAANTFIYVAMKTETIRQWVSSWAGVVLMGVIGLLALWYILSLESEESIDKA